MNQLNSKKLVYLGLGLILLITLILHLRLYIIAPFHYHGDVFEYFTFINKIIDEQSTKNLVHLTGVGLTPYFPIYSTTPLFFILNADLFLFTSFKLPYLFIGLNIIKIIITAFLIFGIIYCPPVISLQKTMLDLLM